MPSKGEKYVAYGHWRPSARVYVTVTRVAKDHAWADCRMETAYASWTKRMPLFDGEFSDKAELILRDWTISDLVEAEADNVARCREEQAELIDGSSDA